MKSRPTSSTVLAALALSVVLVALASEAHAQAAAGIQLDRGSRRYLISKDIGNERWAISFNLDERTVTGNVFKTDGSPPSFISCDITSETPAPNPADNQYLLDCFGADACAAAPCSDQAWTLIASNIPISGSFLLPDESRASFSGNIEPIFAQRCALPACHSGPASQQGLNLEADQAYKNIFLVPAVGDPDHFLIAPFDLTESHVYHKVTNMQEEGQGVQMPFGGPPLSQEQIQAIADWILEGAANN